VSLSTRLYSLSVFIEADLNILVDANLDVLRRGCFNYFLLGGDCVQGPVSMLSA